MKLHNTILELKGNIRVFCRVRPLLPKEGSNTKTIAFPTSTEAMGRGVELWQNGQKHPFMFDKVFVSDTAQQDVFVEISQLVQSALDGYKVCIFAYGQTGSGKTFTMMGKPGFSEMKGLIPRSLEQIFATRQSLQSQGWKYELQVLMLEIYNKTIHDLLSTSKSGVTETTSGKQYTIKHDVNGNTHVSDLTIVDVNSSKEVAYLLDKAAQSRFVGKILMNEQSELEEELLVYFIEQEMKECFASCLFACYDLIRADVVLEVAWLNNMIDFAFPYLLQFIR
ncbi:hypothetical protein RND81_14G199900 [Saponaria officinalis]|uniref:Kinesin motor domain-containing protein n=1 Tax=Saponaria officinalis TaxID=3572 RepID=A0AAW1GSM3_SAPOF